MCIFLNNILLYFLKATKNNIFSSNFVDCIICMDADKNIIFYPCKHYYCCSKCSTNLKLCPICRNRIKLKIFV